MFMKYLIPAIALLGFAAASTAVSAAPKPQDKNAHHPAVHHKKHVAEPSSAQAAPAQPSEEPKFFTPHEWPRSY